VLALAPTPRTVVLAGCETGASVGDADGLGLAQAFLVAGSEEVLAPTRRVPDALAAELSRALDESGDPSSSLAVRARSAMLALKAKDPDGAWTAFRVLVP
jgi:CHAT domain-containing protein